MAARKLSIRGNPERTSKLIASAFDALPPAFVLTSGGTMLHANVRAQHLLARGDAPTARDLLNGAHPAWELVRIENESAWLAIQRRRPTLDELVAEAARRFGLTRRQAQVLGLLAAGRSYQAIGATLGCSHKTVESHVSAVLVRLEVTSRAQAVARLLE